MSIKVFLVKNESGFSRRDFIKISVPGSMTLYLGMKPIHALAQQLMTLDRVSWSPALDGKPIQCVDAIAKVTGAKVLSRDVGANDMPGLPGNPIGALGLFLK